MLTSTATLCIGLYMLFTFSLLISEAVGDKEVFICLGGIVVGLAVGVLSIISLATG